MLYESLLEEASEQRLNVYERTMSKRIKGLYGDNVIWINKRISTNAERYCVLAEEIGHHYTSFGDITNQEDIRNRKQELRARSWAFGHTVPLAKIVQAHKYGVRNKYELADFVGVTEEFLASSINRYQDKYGQTVNHEGYTICFEPLGVVEWFE